MIDLICFITVKSIAIVPTKNDKYPDIYLKLKEDLIIKIFA